MLPVQVDKGLQSGGVFYCIEVVAFTYSTKVSSTGYLYLVSLIMEQFCYNSASEVAVDKSGYITYNTIDFKVLFVVKRAAPQCYCLALLVVRRRCLDSQEPKVPQPY